MSIARSQSAPVPISQAYEKSKAAKGSNRGTVPIARSQSFEAGTWQTPPKPLYGARSAERNDPFSLSTFFPDQSAREEEEWGWVTGGRSGLYDVPEGGAEEAATMPEGVVGGIMLGRVEDEMTGQSIKGEDKLGVSVLNDLLFPTASQQCAVDKKIQSSSITEVFIEEQEEGERSNYGSLMVTGFRDMVGL